MRQRDALTAEQERELEALERALAAEPVEFDLRELEELVHDIRATAPEMSPGFAARLEHEVTEGFPTPRERPPLRARRPRRWVLLPAAGSLAAVLVALVVVLGSGGGGSGGDEASVALPDDPGSAQREQAAPSAGGVTDSAGSGGGAPAAGGSGGAAGGGSGASGRPAASAHSAAAAPPAAPAPSAARAKSLPAPSPVPGSARKVERSAVLALQTTDDEFAATTDAVIATVGRFGGIVASSQIGATDASGGEASFDLRIPTDRLDRALAALSKLGHVTERSQALQDITASFQSVQEHLTDARAERRGLLRALARATTQQRIDSLKAQLRSVSGRIATLKGRRAALRRRADLSTVELTVVGGAASDGTGGGGQWTPGDAAGDALRVLEVLAGVALISLAVLVPLGLLGAAIALAVRLGRRRRREATLDPA